MPRLVFLAGARSNLLDIQDYIATDNPARAVTFTAELVRQCEKLAGLPGTHGRPRPELRPDLRSFAHKGYVILFRYIGDSFEVVMIIEGHRDIERLFT